MHKLFKRNRIYLENTSALREKFSTMYVLTPLTALCVSKGKQLRLAKMTWSKSPLVQSLIIAFKNNKLVFMKTGIAEENDRKQKMFVFTPLQSK